jgi:hypothetical protein
MVPWQEQVFGAWGLAVPLLPAVVAVSALLSLISALWTRMGWRPDWGGWLLSVSAALLLCLWRARWWGFGYLCANPFLGVGYLLPLVLILLVPQLLAYPLSLGRPLKRVWLTALIAFAGSVFWIVMAIMSGATSD